jgi:hypothetical protein
MLSLNVDTKVIDDFVNEYIDNLIERKEYIINHTIQINKKKLKASKADKKFLDEFVTRENLTQILKFTPLEQYSYITQMITKYPKLHQRNEKIYKLIYSIFVGYGYEKIDKFKFIDNLAINTCPYCNRAYIYTINKNKNLKAEIDHFYPKSIYPYLAMTFYNLIPSCPTCNGLGAKGNRDSYKDNLKNPYEIQNDDFKFKFDIDSVEIINSEIEPKSVSIYLDKKIDSNNNYFQIEILYQEHRDVVVELYQKLYQKETKEHFEALRSSLSGLDVSNEDIYRYLTCGYFDTKDFHKRPLSKFIKDISEELF